MGDTERERSAAKVLVAISIGAFLATFNETFLNVALTPIMHDFGVTSGDVQWVSTAYMLVAAVTVPVTSFLYRSVPTRRLSLIALALLLAGTLLGAASSSFPMLIVARCIQALGTGMIVPIGMNLTLLVAPQGKLGTYGRGERGDARGPGVRAHCGRADAFRRRLACALHRVRGARCGCDCGECPVRGQFREAYPSQARCAFGGAYLRGAHRRHVRDLHGVFGQRHGGGRIVRGGRGVLGRVRDSPARD